MIFFQSLFKLTHSLWNSEISVISVLSSIYMRRKLGGQLILTRLIYGIFWSVFKHRSYIVAFEESAVGRASLCHRPRNFNLCGFWTWTSNLVSSQNLYHTSGNCCALLSLTPLVCRAESLIQARESWDVFFFFFFFSFFLFFLTDRHKERWFLLIWLTIIAAYLIFFFFFFFSFQEKGSKKVQYNWTSPDLQYRS